MTSSLTERLARAIEQSAEFVTGNERWGKVWLEDPMVVARAVLTELRASGYAIVPREPTEAMIKAAFNPGLSGDTPSPDDAWRDMVAAGELT